MSYTDFAEDSYIVVCYGDRIGRRLPPYVLATRQTFATRAAADTYARTVSPSRKPLVIAGRFSQLREAL